MKEPARARYERYREALSGVALPAAFVDLDALEENVDRVKAAVRAGGKTLRVASKSIRVPALLRRILERGGREFAGILTYAAQETAFLHEQGFDDLLLAYPTVQASDLDALSEIIRRGGNVSLVADCTEHLDAIEAAAQRADVTMQVVIDVDVSFRPLASLHVGVRRSPLRSPEEVAAFADRLTARPRLRLHGVMAYEAHIAGVGDANPFARLMDAPKRAMKLAARKQLESTRQAIARALAERGHRLTLFNGGGTGSLAWTPHEPSLTEVSAGSGFLDSHLFDYFRDVSWIPAAYFALQVVRIPAPGIVTCHGGGYVASGEAGADRLPIPALPEGAALLPLEGAGEVQTPVRLPRGLELSVGEPLFFRHAKAGELAEHFHEYVLVRGSTIEGRVPTYRGLSRCFLG